MLVRTKYIEIKEQSGFYLLDIGVSPEKIEPCHQSVDWPVTENYIDAVGQHFGIKVTFQWRANGIYGELLRKDSLTGDVYYCDNGKVSQLKTQNGKADISNNGLWS